MLKKRGIIFLVFFLTICFLYSEENLDYLNSEMNSNDEIQTKQPNWGFIFNTSNIFLDIESYQAGFGAKAILEDDLALRFLVDGYYSSSTDTFSISLGTAVEKHFRRQRVSPYWGGFIELGFMRQFEEFDSDNWTENLHFPLSAGVILGVEFFIFENVSLFAEYNLVFEGSITSSTYSESGVETEYDPEFSYSIDTGIGNEAMLGIIIYLDDIINIDRNN